MSLGLGNSLSKGGTSGPTIVTDGLVLKHQYDAGAVVPVSDGAAYFESANTNWITIPERTLDVHDSNITFTFWAKRTIVSAVKTVFGHSGESNERHVRFVGDGTLKIESDEANDEAVITLNNANDYLWHHYAIVCQSGTVTAFQDGVSCSVSGDVNGASIILDRIGSGTSYQFSGYLCNVSFWSGALTQAQIKSVMWKNHEGLTDTEKNLGLISWWNLSENAEDLQGGQNGTLA